ncbi:MAG: stage II sporulation protein R [Anaerolineaceae bacterium]|nr:MAG: stage II sporulation protein R [Anaerolineaceae bacterium]
MNKKSGKFNLNFIHNKILDSDQNSSQMRLFFLLLLLISSLAIAQLVRIHSADPSRLQQKIAHEIIRFHVIANSDSDEDQYLKYQIKDALVECLQPYLMDVHDVEEAQDILTDMLPYIQKVASQVIDKNGYNYLVTASISSTYFPMKVYGDYTFPPGRYEALQVRIGSAKGKNWWCVMFPPLCFVDETYSIVDEDGKEKLKYLLTEDEFDALKNNKVPIKIRFKLFDSIKKLFS